VEVWLTGINHNCTIGTVPLSTALVNGALNHTEEPNVIVTPIAPHSLPTVSQYQVLGRARFSGTDPLGAQHTQVDSLTQHAQENQSSPSAFPSYLVTSQYPAAVPADITQGPSSYTHRDSVAPLYSEDSLQLPSPSALQDDLDSNATFSPRRASADTPSHFTGHTLPQQGASMAAPETLRKKLPTGQRKRSANPKDPKAAERLQNQRQSDDEHIEYLYKLFVPDSVGAVPKKDRLRMSTSHSLCLSS